MIAICKLQPLMLFPAATVPLSRSCLYLIAMCKLQSFMLFPAATVPLRRSCLYLIAVCKLQSLMLSPTATHPLRRSWREMSCGCPAPSSPPPTAQLSTTETALRARCALPSSTTTRPRASLPVLRLDPSPCARTKPALPTWAGAPLGLVPRTSRPTLSCILSVTPPVPRVTPTASVCSPRTPALVSAVTSSSSASSFYREP